jgi:hypothetical protein
LAFVVVPIPDVPNHPRFAEHVATSVATTFPHLPAPTPDNTVVACSTPVVADSYRALGHTVVGVEADMPRPAPHRPWDVVEILAAGDPAWRRLAHPQTVAFYERYGFDTTICDLFGDPVISDEGDLTGTRDYRTYAAAFENASNRKCDLVAPHIEPGRIVDIGCATGGLLERIAADPRLSESDLFGVDVARPLLAETKHKKSVVVFANPNIGFVRANMLSGLVMPPCSVDKHRCMHSCSRPPSPRREPSRWSAQSGDGVTFEKVLGQLHLTDEDHDALAEQVGEALDQAEQNDSTLCRRVSSRS